MWSGKDKVWLTYRKDILATDNAEGKFLADYLRYMAANTGYTAHIELIDLQRYRVVRQPQRIKAALHTRFEVPFIFVTGKN